MAKTRAPRIPSSPEVDRAMFNKSDRQRAKTEVIVRAAARLIYQRGVADTSLDDVAEELGIAKPSLYYYVKNKEELIYLCNRRIFDLKSDIIEEADRLGKNGAEKIEHILRGLVELVLDPESGMPRLWQSGQQGMLSEDRREDIDKLHLAQSRRMHSIIRKGIKDGSLRENDPEIVETAILGAIFWLPMSNAFDADADVETLTKAYSDLFFHGMFMN